MFRKIFSLIIFSLSSIFACEVNLENESFVWDLPYPRSVHAANICELPDGSLLTVFFGGTYEKCPDVSIWLSRKNGDSNWSRPKEILKGLCDKTNVRLPLWNPILTVLPDKSTILFFKKGESPRTWKGYFCLSKDCGKTWSEEIALPDNIFGPTKCKALILESGFIVSPSSVEATSRGGWSVRFEKSRLDMKDWSVHSPSSAVTNLFLTSLGIDAIQPALLKLKDNSLLAVCRTQNEFLYITKSKDDGETWSDLKKTEIPNVNSAIDALLLDNGAIIIAGNFDPQKKRKKLSLIKTYDFKTWSEIYVFEDKDAGEYSYPSIIQSKDGNIHIVYTYKRRYIKYAKLSLK